MASMSSRFYHDDNFKWTALAVTLSTIPIIGGITFLMCDSHLYCDLVCGHIHTLLRTRTPEDEPEEVVSSLHRKLSAVHCKACHLDIGDISMSINLPFLMALAKRPRSLQEKPQNASRRSRAIKLEQVLDHLPDQVKDLQDS